MKEIDIAFQLVKAALDGQAPSFGTQPIETSTWWSLFQLMQRNHLAAMTAETVATLDVSREVKIPWLAEQDKATSWFHHQLEVQEDIRDVMWHHGIETLVLKGTHTAQYYPRPEMREFGDLDLYFYDRHEDADRVARKDLGVEVTNEAHHHSRYNYRGVTVESHYDFVNRHYPPSNQRYEALLKELVSNPSPKSGEVPVRAEKCAPDFEVLFLLRHMAGHFAASRITMRDLVDWTLTCRALEKQTDWRKVEQTIQTYGMKRFAQALCTIASRRLGMTPPLAFNGGPCMAEEIQKVEHNIVYGDVKDHADDGLGRLLWKIRRWKALEWKREMVYNDSASRLLASSLTSHASRPQSILHKM